MSFERATEYRFLHTLLREPFDGRREALEALATTMSFEEGADSGPLLAASDERAQTEAFRLLGQAGRVSVCASDYVDGGYADKGPILADIAGFYGAFGFRPTMPENPDHFANIFEFLAVLALKEAWALEEGDLEGAEVARDAERKLVEEHVHPYLGRFAERLASFAAPDGVYGPVAEYVGRREGEL
jgi:nitrate reductase assembly molybdenum cofactor insertion protein NarJ